MRPLHVVARVLGHQVSYHGVRQADGRIAASRVELGVPAPADAYKMPHGIEIVAAKDKQTGIDILEFRKGKKVEGRQKLFPVRAVQEYVSHLGDSLLPPSADVHQQARPLRLEQRAVARASRGQDGDAKGDALPPASKNSGRVMMRNRRSRVNGQVGHVAPIIKIREGAGSYSACGFRRWRPSRSLFCR